MNIGEVEKWKGSWKFCILPGMLKAGKDNEDLV